MTKKKKAAVKKRPAPKTGPVVNAVSVEDFNIVIKGLNAVVEELTELKMRVAALERAELLRRAGPTVENKKFSPQIPLN